MKIAYIILAHIDPQHIARLANKITKNTSNKAFIHVDKKYDIEPFRLQCNLINNSSIIFIKNRVNVNWAGFSSVKSTVNCFDEIIKTNEKFDRYIILQGLDYPIKNNNEIEKFFIDNPNKEYICAINETHSKNFSDIHKYRFFWCWDKKNIFQKFLNNIDILLFHLKLPIWVKKPYIKLKDNKTYEIYRGWAHFAITEEAVKYILNFYKSNTKFNNYFKSVYASDESYFHTILYNDEYFKDKLPENCPIKQSDRSNEKLLNVTYFEYPSEGVRVFKDKSEYKFLSNTKYLYFRKANTIESKDLLDYIDNIHNYENELN